MDNGKPDRLDQQIIRHLRQDGRRSTREIAANLDVTEATVTSRIRALNEDGAMRVMAQRNVTLLREPMPVFANIWVRGRSIDDVAAELTAIERIAAVHICVGSPELHIIGFVEENTLALARLQAAISQVPGVERLEVNLALDIRTYRSDYANLDLTPPGGEGMPDPLDDKIVRQLQMDGRVSNREIARVLDLPASTVRERVNRLLATEAIRIGAVCDAQKLGLTLTAFGYLQVSAPQLEPALSYLQAIDDLGICAAVSGRYNIYVLLGVRDFDRLVGVVKTRLEATPGLGDISIRMVADTKKHRADLIKIVSPR